MLIERYNEVKKHVEEACKRVGRDLREVTVIAGIKRKRPQRCDADRSQQDQTIRNGRRIKKRKST